MVNKAFIIIIKLIAAFLIFYLVKNFIVTLAT